MANSALDGMQKILIGNVGFFRYADDSVVTAKTRKEVEANLPIIRDWLVERVLKLNPEKTSICPMDEGFEFLGFDLGHFRMASA